MEHLYDKLEDYAASNYYPYHMPGHKRQLFGSLPEELYKLDITEIPGFDDLHNPEEIIDTLQQRASNLYHAKKSYYLINGSSCGVMAAISATVPRGGKIIMARNCHKSAYYAAFLRQLQIGYIYPEKMQDKNIYEAISLENVKAAYEKNKDASAIIIVSPTYEGRISNISEIVEFAHDKKITLIVDEAHGAHLGFSKRLSINSNNAGADIVIHSVHKTLPAFTQSALLHVNGDLVDIHRIKKFLDIYQTSSPSYILMSGIDNALNIVDKQGDKLFDEFIDNFLWMMKELSRCKYFSFLPIKEDLASINIHEKYVSKHDIGKLVICCDNTPYNGQEVYEILKDKYQLQLEMAAGDYCLAMFTIGDTKEGFERMVAALTELDYSISNEPDYNNIEKKDISQITAKAYTEAKSVIPLYEAWEGEFQEVTLENAVGKISKEFVNLYPPGIPILVPGEEITEEAVDIIKAYVDMKLNVQGIYGEGNKIRILSK